jgi:hypothetical protein
MRSLLEDQQPSSPQSLGRLSGTSQSSGVSSVRISSQSSARALSVIGGGEGGEGAAGLTRRKSQPSLSTLPHKIANAPREDSGSSGSGSAGAGSGKRGGIRAMADVVAGTAVECLVLDRQTMDWALSSSADGKKIKRELERDVQRRSAQLKAKLHHSNSSKNLPKAATSPVKQFDDSSKILKVSSPVKVSRDGDDDDVFLAVDESEIALRL